ncbi:MAG: type II secretion system protein [Nitrosomonas sp.]|nr:type II secretion system protein [Nitrosomonas sp.]
MRSSKTQGYIYIWTLFATMLAGVMLAAAGEIWQTTSQREKELELLFIGDQFRLAITSYHDAAQGGTATSRYPETLEHLLEDKRGPKPLRHLRKIFLDPMTNRFEWGVVEQESGGITGVYSLSTLQPIKRGNFPKAYSQFEKAQNYQDWQFVHAEAASAKSINDRDASQSPGSSSNPFERPATSPVDNPFSQPPSPERRNPFENR